MKWRLLNILGPAQMLPNSNPFCCGGRLAGRSQKPSPTILIMNHGSWTLSGLPRILNCLLLFQNRGVGEGEIIWLGETGGLPAITLYAMGRLEGSVQTSSSIIRETRSLAQLKHLNRAQFGAKVLNQKQREHFMQMYPRNVISELTHSPICPITNKFNSFKVPFSWWFFQLWSSPTAL